MLSARELFLFCEKMGPFFLGGVPPVVAPEGDLGFRESRVALFIELEVFTWWSPTGVLGT
jgi:hypothetical protein